MTVQDIIKSVYDMTIEGSSNVYVGLDGIIRPRLNPTPGLYHFDGQIFYRKKHTVWIHSTPQGNNYFHDLYMNGKFDGRA